MKLTDQKAAPHGCRRDPTPARWSVKSFNTAQFVLPSRSIHLRKSLEKSSKLLLETQDRSPNQAPWCRRARRAKGLESRPSRLELGACWSFGRAISRYPHSRTASRYARPRFVTE